MAREFILYTYLCPSPVAVNGYKLYNGPEVEVSGKRKTETIYTPHIYYNITAVVLNIF